MSEYPTWNYELDDRSKQFSSAGASFSPPEFPVVLSALKSEISEFPVVLNAAYNLACGVCLNPRSDRLLEQCSIALVGKYTKFTDSYASVIKALEHSALAINHKLEIKVNTNKLHTCTSYTLGRHYMPVSWTYNKKHLQCRKDYA